MVYDPHAGQGDFVPIPTAAEIAEARALGREILACSALKIGPLIYMRFAFSNGQHSTAILGGAAEYHLLSVLKAVVPEHAIVAAAPVEETAHGLETRAGRM